MSKAKKLFVILVVKYGEMNKIANEDLASLREEVSRSQEGLVKEFSSKISNLGTKVVELSTEGEIL